MGCRSLRNSYGCSQERLYSVYNGMISRCYNKNHPGYKNWGGRGIAVCDEWRNDYQAFKRWALKAGYDENKDRKYQTLDRINNDGNYCPENCRWATQSEQNRNQRKRNRRTGVGYKYNWTINGITKSAVEWCKDYNVSVPMVMHRVRTMGMKPIEALSRPVKRANNTYGITVENVVDLRKKGMTIRQIATSLGCSKNTVKRRLKEGKSLCYGISD